MFNRFSHGFRHENHRQASSSIMSLVRAQFFIERRTFSLIQNEQTKIFRPRCSAFSAAAAFAKYTLKECLLSPSMPSCISAFSPPSKCRFFVTRTKRVARISPSRGGTYKSPGNPPSRIAFPVEFRADNQAAYLRSIISRYPICHRIAVLVIALHDLRYLVSPAFVPNLCVIVR